tara:strand:- start:31344 stop:32519 length:1176 start_codon:yes stop_codon:yes gene_type:complete
MNEVLVSVENLSKKFCKDLKTSLWYGVKDLASGLGGNRNERELRPKEFWAVKDISFELKRGECLGLIGHNGAGKSTLLKILNGLINPDAGKVTIKGRVGALIELGAGFNPILSGRENIYNNGAILGFTRKEIDEKIEEIIDFAEIREFIDMPVQNYSSGMKVRLGFAVAAQMEPDVLIIDEVLAVGDVSFRAKCYERISELMRSCCVIFVTHSMPQISKLCTKSIMMYKGMVKAQGDNSNVIEAYYDTNNSENKMNVIFDKYCTLKSFIISSTEIKNFTEKITVKVSIESDVELENVSFDLVIMSREFLPIAQLNSKILRQEISLSKGLNNYNIILNELGLNVGIYKISFNISNPVNGEQLLWVQNICDIKIIDDFAGHCPILLRGSFERK